MTACAAPGSTWVAFGLAAIVWLPLGLAIGLAVGRLVTKIACRRAWHEGELAGLERGKRLGRETLFCAVDGDLRRRVVQDVIADDSATAFSEPAA